MKSLDHDFEQSQKGRKHWTIFFGMMKTKCAHYDILDNGFG